MKFNIKLVTNLSLLTLSALSFNACVQKDDKINLQATSVQGSETVSKGGIAYVNLDSLEANYAYFQTRKEAFEKKQTSMEAELQRLARNLENEAKQFQNKIQTGTISTQAQAEAEEARLYKMQANLENRKNTLAEELFKEQEAFNKELRANINEFLMKYNEDKGYDYILSYIEEGSILYANKALDITKDVIMGMNNLANEKTENDPPKSDTAK